MTSHEYKISILLPTRGRSDALERSIKSLYELADNPESIQLMLGIDTDDADGISAFQEYSCIEFRRRLDDILER